MIDDVDTDRSGPTVALEDRRATTLDLEEVFLGRRREMRELDLHLERACAGQGTLLLLLGDPGIGKTRTARELAKLAQQRGCRVWWGRCWKGESAPAYWPWIQIFRACLDDLRDETQDSPLRETLPHLAQLVPDLVAQLDVGAPTIATSVADGERLQSYDAVVSCLLKLGESQPLVIVVDDLQWADRPSILLLRLLAQRLRSSRVLVVATYRDCTVDGEHPLVDEIAELGRDSRRIVLDGLAREDVGSLVARAFDESACDRLSAEVHRRTGGNPFFVLEVLQLINDHGGLDLAPVAVPPGVREMIYARLAELSADARDLLAQASVLGTDADVAVVSWATGWSPERQSAALGEAFRTRMIELPAETPKRLHFSHVLVRDAIYEQLGAVQRADLHRRAGEALEALGDGGMPAAAASLAFHFFRSISGADGPKALRYSMSAGSEAMERLAYENALEHYRRALLLVADDTSSEQLRYELHMAIGAAHSALSDAPAAREAYSEAIDIARSMGSAELFARAVLGYGGRFIGLAPNRPVDHGLVSLLRDALAMLEPHDSELRATVLARLSRALYRDAASAERRSQLSADALAMARRTGDKGALVAALNSRYWSLCRPEESDQRVVIANEMVSLAESVGDEEMVLQGLQWSLIEQWATGRMSTADVLLDQYRDLAQRRRQPLYQYVAATLYATRTLLAGHLDEGHGLARDAMQAGLAAQVPGAERFYAAQVFSSMREQGRLCEVDDILSSSPPCPCLPCRVAQRLIDTETSPGGEPEVGLDDLVAEGLSTLSLQADWLATVAMLGELTCRDGNRARARVLYDLLVPHAERFVVVRPGIAWHGSVARTLARLAATLGEPEDARRHFEVAIVNTAACGARAHLARTRYEYASFLVRNEPAASATQVADVLEKAELAARELGMTALLRDADALRARIADRGPAPPPPMPMLLTAAPGVEPATEPGGNRFVRSGDFWAVRFGGVEVSIRDVLGMRYLALLLADPGREHHVADIAGRGRRPTGSWAGPAPARSARCHDSLLDAQAVQAYKQRLVDLEDELDEARRFSDDGRQLSLERERDFVVAELTRAYGLGRPRRWDDPAERARKAVTNRIRATIKRIRSQHPNLGLHLLNSVRTGIFCSYVPETTTRWEVVAPSRSATGSPDVARGDPNDEALGENASPCNVLGVG